MKPIKTLLPLSRWMLRITMLAYLILHNASTIQTLDIKSQAFFVALAFVLFGLLLFAGGFTNSSSLTVVSAIFLSLLFIYHIYIHFVPQVTNVQIISLLLLSISVYFMSSANK